jgi:DNA-binding MarR family transcriptional regulator
MCKTISMPQSPSTDALGRHLHAFVLGRDWLLIALARAAGLSQLDLHALEQLEARGPLTPGELSDCVGLSSGATTALIDRLERIDWVVRSPNQADRRSVLVSPSASAERAGDDALGTYHAAVRRAIERVPRRDRESVARLLMDLTEAALAASERVRAGGGASAG